MGGGGQGIENGWRVRLRLTHHLTGREQLHHFFIIISIAAVAVRGRMMLAALPGRMPVAFVLFAVAARGCFGQ